MGKRRIEIIVFVLCLCLCLAPLCVQSASTTDAKKKIDPDKDCSLTISYHYGENKFSDIPIRLYRIADVSADYQYTLTSAFAGTDLILNGIKAASEWNVIRSTLEIYIIANSITPDMKIMTDQNGQACFNVLKPGLYLAMTEKIIQGDVTYSFDSALVALPGLENDGIWQYEVNVNSKSAVIPPAEPDDEVELKVVKLWKGDSGLADRPQSIEVEIFRDGTSYKKVTLSEDNHWSYSWSVKNDGADWMVIERNIPAGYTMTIEERATSFVLTNTWIEENPDKPNPPQTGDTVNLLLYIILMTVSGVVFVAVGFIGKRKRT